VNLGIPLMLNSPQSPLSKSITALADALLETEPAEASTNWGRRQMCRLKSMAALLGAMVLWCGYDYRSTS
jgi:hypothetical protein